MTSPSFRSEPSRRKSSEVSASMKIRLEAFEDRRKTDSLSDEARAKEKLERSRLNKEKLLEIAKKNAAKILKSGGDYLGMDTVKIF